jgi:hypothetical protein
MQDSGRQSLQGLAMDQIWGLKEGSIKDASLAFNLSPYWVGTGVGKG